MCAVEVLLLVLARAAVAGVPDAPTRGRVRTISALPLPMAVEGVLEPRPLAAPLGGSSHVSALDTLLRTDGGGPCPDALRPTGPPVPWRGMLEVPRVAMPLSAPRRLRLLLRKL